jgi:predicted HD superfamily hydrolase involved in NAD metabolism
VIADGIAFVDAARRVREQLGQRHRYEHTLGVTRTAERLAATHGADAYRARIAGLLHDLARLYPVERLVAECIARGLPIDAFERANPIVLHARVGAELAREMFGVDDAQILSAIRKHTLAADTMSTLDAVLFLADALEPGRDYAERPALLALAFRDLDAAMRAVLDSTLDHLRARGLTPAPQTLAARNLYTVPHQREKRSA